MKITPESMKEEYDNLWMTFCEKNHDYGSSFEQSLDRYGLLAGVVRMEDKMNRVSTLVDVDKHAKIASESLVDTLRDLSNYSAMAACWLMAKEAGVEPTESGKFTGLKVFGDDIDVEGFIYRCLVHKIDKIGKNYIYNLRWINERRKSNN